MAKQYNSDSKEEEKSEGSVRDRELAKHTGEGQARHAADEIISRKERNRRALREAMKHTGGGRKAG